VTFAQPFASFDAEFQYRAIYEELKVGTAPIKSTAQQKPLIGTSICRVGRLR